MAFTIKKQLKNSPWVLVTLACISAVLLVLALGVGYYNIKLAEVMRLLFGKGSSDIAKNIVLNIRLPRVLAAYAIGAGLSVSGAAYQGVFKNPLVSPDILGVASGAGVGAALAIVLGLSYIYIQAFAFVFGILAVTFAYVLSINVKFGRKVSMILAGTMVGALSFSVVSLIKYFADVSAQLPEITYWLMGSIAKANTQALTFSLPVMLLGFVMLMLMRNRINVLTLSDEEAMSLGVNPKRNMRFVVLASTLVCSGAVCLGGTIGWVGLFIPHISRGLIGAGYAKLLPVSAMLGGCFLLVVDSIARSLLTVEIPIGLLISFIGAPFFYMLIRKGGLK